MLKKIWLIYEALRLIFVSVWSKESDSDGPDLGKGVVFNFCSHCHGVMGAAELLPRIQVPGDFSSM